MMAAPAPQGIDNVVYGQTGYGATYAAPRPVYAAGTGYAPPAPAYAAPAAYARPAPVYAAAAPAYATSPAAYTTPAPLYAPPAQQPYTLDSGDRLRVVVFGQDGLTNSYVVDASGQIAMPLIGTVSARGLSTDQLSTRIADLLRQGYVREPHLAVEVEAYRPFFILGEVAAPGQYPYVANMTVETAVAIAGGFGPRGYRKTVTISRTTNGQTMRFEAPVTTPVRPGDTIQVDERWF
jgi:polysaccharide export outer membrane protein